jgi:hypothetical protein
MMTVQVARFMAMTPRGRMFAFLDAAANWRRVGDKGHAIRDCLTRAREQRLSLGKKDRLP